LDGSDYTVYIAYCIYYIDDYFRSAIERDFIMPSKKKLKKQLKRARENTVILLDCFNVEIPEGAKITEARLVLYDKPPYHGHSISWEGIEYE